jgi:phage baseplate assembly protein W
MTTAYRDIDLNFVPLPTTKDCSTIIGPNAIATSIENLVLTNLYDRPFQPDNGGDVYKFLFLTFNQALANSAGTMIKDMLAYYEPRAYNYGVKIVQTDKSLAISVNFILSDGMVYQTVVNVSRTL